MGGVVTVWAMRQRVRRVSSSLNRITLPYTHAVKWRLLNLTKIATTLRALQINSLFLIPISFLPGSISAIVDRMCRTNYQEDASCIVGRPSGSSTLCWFMSWYTTMATHARSINFTPNREVNHCRFTCVFCAWPLPEATSVTARTYRLWVICRKVHGLSVTVCSLDS